MTEFTPKVPDTQPDPKSGPPAAENPLNLTPAQLFELDSALDQELEAELEALLARTSPIGSAYRDSTLSAPPELDAAVLAFAAQQQAPTSAPAQIEAQQSQSTPANSATDSPAPHQVRAALHSTNTNYRRRNAQLARWRGPLAIAATLVLVVGVLQHRPPEPSRPTMSPSPAQSAVPAVIGNAVKEKVEAEKKVADDNVKHKAELKAEPVATQPRTDARMADAAVKPLELARDADKFQAQSAERAKVAAVAAKQTQRSEPEGIPRSTAAAAVPPPPPSTAALSASASAPVANTVAEADLPARTAETVNAPAPAIEPPIVPVVAPIPSVPAPRTRAAEHDDEASPPAAAAAPPPPMILAPSRPHAQPSSQPFSALYGQWHIVDTTSLAASDKEVAAVMDSPSALGKLSPGSATSTTDQLTISADTIIIGGQTCADPAYVVTNPATSSTLVITSRCGTLTLLNQDHLRFEQSGRVFEAIRNR